jgi:hypothetical protein
MVDFFGILLGWADRSSATPAREWNCGLKAKVPTGLRFISPVGT